MKQSKVLDCLKEVAVWQFQLTGDKWWSDLGENVDKKRKEIDV